MALCIMQATDAEVTSPNVRGYLSRQRTRSRFAEGPSHCRLRNVGVHAIARAGVQVQQEIEDKTNSGIWAAALRIKISCNCLPYGKPFLRNKLLDKKEFVIHFSTITDHRYRILQFGDERPYSNVSTGNICAYSGPRR
jgi:hypothetical protein